MLTEPQRQQLDGIVQQMVQNKEPEANIQFVVSDFKKKYDKQPQVVQKQQSKENTGFFDSKKSRADLAIGIGQTGLKMLKGPAKLIESAGKGLGNFLAEKAGFEGGELSQNFNKSAVSNIIPDSITKARNTEQQVGQFIGDLGAFGFTGGVAGGLAKGTGLVPSIARLVAPGAKAGLGRRALGTGLDFAATTAGLEGEVGPETVLAGVTGAVFPLGGAAITASKKGLESLGGYALQKLYKFKPAFVGQEKVGSEVLNKWMIDRGFVNAPKESQKKLVDYWTGLYKEQDKGLDTITGTIKTNEAPIINQALNQLRNFYKSFDKDATSAVDKMILKSNSKGLTAKEIHSVKGEFERTFAYPKGNVIITPKQAATNKYVSDNLRGLLVNLAEKGGFKNFPLFQKEIQTSHAILNQLGNTVSKNAEQDAIGFADKLAIGAAIFGHPQAAIADTVLKIAASEKSLAAIANKFIKGIGSLKKPTVDIAEVLSRNTVKDLAKKVGVRSNEMVKFKNFIQKLKLQINTPAPKALPAGPKLPGNFNNRTLPPVQANPIPLTDYTPDLSRYGSFPLTPRIKNSIPRP